MFFFKKITYRLISLFATHRTVAKYYKMCRYVAPFFFIKCGKILTEFYFVSATFRHNLPYFFHMPGVAIFSHIAAGSSMWHHLLPHALLGFFAL